MRPDGAGDTGEGGAEGEGDELDAEAATEALLQWYMERLDSSNDAANAASRAMMGYLRNDWEDFLSSLAKRHRAQQQVTGS